MTRGQRIAATTCFALVAASLVCAQASINLQNNKVLLSFANDPTYGGRLANADNDLPSPSAPPYTYTNHAGAMWAVVLHTVPMTQPVTILPNSTGFTWGPPVLIGSDYIMVPSGKQSFPSDIAPGGPIDLFIWQRGAEGAMGHPLIVGHWAADTQTLADQTNPEEAAFVAFLRHDAEFFQSAASYLRFGQRLQPLANNSTHPFPASYPAPPPTTKPETDDYRAVYSTVWRSSLGRVGIVLMNWTNSAQAVPFTFNPSAYGVSYPFTVYDPTASFTITSGTFAPNGDPPPAPPVYSVPPRSYRLIELY